MQCYMCSSESVSMEHVPPRCIFPECKDLSKGVDYRKNLITIPSCAEHNLQNSYDDEYFFYVLVSNWGTNSAGINHWNTKILRSLNKSPSKLGIYKNFKTVQINGITTGAYVIDFGRLCREIDKISRGIYFHHFNKQWNYPIEIVLPAAISIGKPESRDNNKVVRNTSDMIAQILSNEKKYGDNPDIFYYQYKIEEVILGYILRMIFYGSIEIVTLSNLPKST